MPRPVGSPRGAGTIIRSGARAPPADALVIFGITGDLAKKMTFKALYDLVENGTLKVPVIGVARNDWSRRGPAISTPATRSRARAEAGDDEFDEDVFKRFTRAAHLRPGRLHRRRRPTSA